MREPTFSNLRAFLDRLRRDGDLAVVDAPVSARLEVGGIHKSVSAAAGSALLFTHVPAPPRPRAPPRRGPPRRAHRACGTRPTRLTARPAPLAQTILPP